VHALCGGQDAPAGLRAAVSSGRTRLEHSLSSSKAEGYSKRQRQAETKMMKRAARAADWFWLSVFLALLDQLGSWTDV
jgi:hypothetical protein